MGVHCRPLAGNGPTLSSSPKIKGKTRTPEKHGNDTRCLIVGGMGTLRGIPLSNASCGTWVAFRGGDGHLPAQTVDNPYVA
jgi:hypothetical protein